MRCLVLLISVTVAALYAQPGEQRLAPHSTLSQILAGGEERIYRLEVPAGQVMDVSIREEQGVAGILIVEQDERAATEVDFVKRIPAAKRVLVALGDSRLKLMPANHSPMARIFEISVGEFRPLPKTTGCAFPPSS